MQQIRPQWVVGLLFTVGTVPTDPAGQPRTWACDRAPQWTPGAASLLPLHRQPIPA